jgi:ATP-dependent HslUV protease ATP-binding subunit HslU
VPKNILMIGPTGCGKTEIARRLAKLTDAPFIKVEATKFTEVGFHGRDVDTIIRDLVEAALPLTRAKLRARHAPAVASAVEDKLLDLVMGADASANSRTTFRGLLRAGDLDANEVVAEVPAPRPQRAVGAVSLGSLSNEGSMSEVMSTSASFYPRSRRRARRRDSRARTMLSRPPSPQWKRCSAAAAQNRRK